MLLVMKILMREMLLKKQSAFESQKEEISNLMQMIVPFLPQKRKEIALLNLTELQLRLLVMRILMREMLLKEQSAF